MKILYSFTRVAIVFSAFAAISPLLANSVEEKTGPSTWTVVPGPDTIEFDEVEGQGIEGVQYWVLKTGSDRWRIRKDCATISETETSELETADAEDNGGQIDVDSTGKFLDFSAN